MMDQTEIQRKQLQFENLLEQTKASVLEALLKISDPAALLTGETFEALVSAHIKNNAIGTEFEGKLEQTPDREFPDIVDHEYFGVEVKATKKDNWTSIGNSVLESSRESATKKIYVFFGKLGGAPDIMIKNYEDVLKGIAVTHYPRYQIDMLIDEKSSIFHKMDTTYEEISQSDSPVKKIKEYYKSITKPGEALWWMDNDSESIAPITSSLVVRNLANFSADERRELLVDLYIHFPGVLGSSTKKYEPVAAYLVTRYNAVTSNMRDFFSAGGVGDIVYKDKTITLPRVALNMLEFADSIQKQPNIDVWLTLIDQQSAYMNLLVPLSELFRAKISGSL